MKVTKYIIAQKTPQFHRFPSVKYCLTSVLNFRRKKLVTIFQRIPYFRSSQLMHNDPVTLLVALDRAGRASGTLYLDDGKSFKVSVFM